MPRPLDNFTPDMATIGHSREPLLMLDLCVVTPLFGGGAVAREVDHERPVSAKAVRGHLRFWWRACRGAHYVTAQELFDEEAKIWGSTEKPAGVEVSVDILNKGEEVTFNQWKDELPRYALFPFHPQHGSQGQPATPGVSCLKGVRFRLCLTGANMHRGDVEAAVWAWVLFGGVGARTRRGCGTLFCVDERFRPSPALLMNGPALHVISGKRALALPCLSGACVITRRPPGLPPKQAWRIAIETMQSFWQGVGFARNPGQQANKPGRSYWPEADSIRRFTGVADRMHQPRHAAGDYFPRADLGLPIVFRFQSSQDPGVQNLQALAQGATRMASSIILKAFPLSESTAVPMAVLLNAPHVWDRGVPNVGFSGHAVPVGQLHDTAKSSSVPPLVGKATAREAFLDFTKNKWNGLEVTLP